MVYLLRFTALSTLNVAYGTRFCIPTENTDTLLACEHLAVTDILREYIYRRICFRLGFRRESVKDLRRTHFYSEEPLDKECKRQIPH